MSLLTPLVRRKNHDRGAPGQGLEPQIRAPEARVLPITPSRKGSPRIVDGPTGKPARTAQARAVCAVDYTLPLRHRTTGREELGNRLLEARVEHKQDLVAGFDDGVGLGNEATASAQHRDDQAAFGQLDVRNALADSRCVGAHL